MGVENLVNAEWAPSRTLVISFSLESTLLESWSIRYSPSQQDLVASSTPMLETRYLASTLLVRQLIVVAEALPATRNAATEYTSMFVETGEEAPLGAFLSEELALPAVNMAFGKVFIQVRYRAEAVARTRRHTSPEPQQEDLDSSSSGGGQQHLSARIMEDYMANKMEGAVGGGGEGEDEGEDENDGDAGEQRWKRWTSDTFTARERELQREEEEDDEEEGEALPPPSELVRQSSHPVNIKPTPLASSIRKRSGRGNSLEPELRRSPIFSSSSLSSSSTTRTGSSAPQMSRKLSNTGLVRRRLGSFRVSSEGEDQPVGDVTDLMGTPPNASSLPHLLGSLAGSANSGDRTRFLSTNSPVFLSAGSLMIYNKTEVASTTPPTAPPGLLAGREPVTTLSLLAASTHEHALAEGEGSKSGGLYESALPWILTAAEMERPFSGLSGSIFLGTALDSRAAKQLTNPVEAAAAGDGDEEESDNFALPFDVAGDEEDSFAQRQSLLPSQSDDELGAFLLRCRQAPSVFDNEPVVQLLGVRKEFELLAVAAATTATASSATKPPPKSSEVITQVDKQ